jgi:LysM repeat protein
MNPQENLGIQEDAGPRESPPIRTGSPGRSSPGPGRHRARLIIAAAAVAGGLLAASAVVNAVVAPGTVSVSAGQPASAAEAPGPAAAANPTPSATQAATAAPVKAAAAKAPAKATAVKAPVVVRKAAPARAPAATTYTVVAGDTVGSIAARFGVDVNSMLAANGLGPYSVIVPGQILKLSGPAVAVPKTAAAPAPAPAQAPAPAPAPAVRTIYVAGAGGQALVDSCIGPIHFTPTDGYSLFITEHDFCGGWARFSGIGVGERVDIPGYGSYTVAARSQVPNPGTTNDVAAVFGGFPRAVLQTCIPGTTQMLVIALN